MDNKDYDIIASVLRKAWENNIMSIETFNILFDEFVVAFRKDYPDFCRSRFKCAVKKGSRR